MAEEPTLYTYFGKDLYRLVETTNNSTSDIDPDRIISGSSVSSVSQSVGLVLSGKTGFSNNETGYILGNDEGVQKFYIGTDTNYFNFDGTNVIISGALSAGSIAIGTSPNWFNVDSSGNSWWGGATIATAVAKILNTGVATFTKITITGGADVSFISDTLNTATKQILGDFTFGASGAIKMNTDENNGIWISPTGILGKKSGATTFAIDNAGNATFAGTLTSGISITSPIITGGSISIGSGNDIFKADSNGIYLGNATFANAPFSVNMAGTAIGNDFIQREKFIAGENLTAGKVAHLGQGAITDYEAVDSTYVYEGSADTNYGNTQPFIGMSATNKMYYALLHFPTAIDYKLIKSVVLYVNVLAVTGGGSEIGVRANNADFDVDTVTWNTKPAGNTTIAAVPTVFSGTYGATGWHTLDITDFYIADKYGSKYANGITLTGTGAVGNYIQISTTSYLKITYRDNDGLVYTANSGTAKGWTQAENAIGIITNSATIGNPAYIQRNGVYVTAGAFNIGEGLYFDDTGTLEHGTGISSGQYMKRVGYAKSATDVDIKIEPSYQSGVISPSGGTTTGKYFVQLGFFPRYIRVTAVGGDNHSIGIYNMDSQYCIGTYEGGSFVSSNVIFHLDTAAANTTASGTIASWLSGFVIDFDTCETYGAVNQILWETFA